MFAAMKVHPIGVSLVALLLCAACGQPASSQASAGGGGSTSASSTGGSGGSGGSGGTTTSTTSGSVGMACELQFTDSAGSNLSQTSFSSGVGQGNTTHKAGHPIEYGIAASANTATSSVIFNITVSGDAPAAGASYTIANDDTSVVDLTINDVTGGTGLHDWAAVAGSKVSVDAVGPGPVPKYTNVTFSLVDVVMEPSKIASMNNAAGTFKVSGKCSGNIQDLMQ